MTAGAGVQHSEMFPLLHSDSENTMELFQIWLNLPRKSKMVTPYFKMLWADDIPKLQFDSGESKGVKIEIIAGNIGEVKAPVPPPDSWAFDPQNQVAIWNIIIPQGSSWELPVSAPDIHRSLFCYQGEIDISRQKIPEYHAADLRPHMATRIGSSTGEARILLLQGRPIAEPVVQHGPFVMNTREEIAQAFNDFQRTRFGGWPWPRYDQVHDRDAGRFARHADGRVEVKS
jgi:redox-sensitive bicupin YhaK (pirin superfamily)